MFFARVTAAIVINNAVRGATRAPRSVLAFTLRGTRSAREGEGRVSAIPHSSAFTLLHSDARFLLVRLRSRRLHRQARLLRHLLGADPQYLRLQNRRLLRVLAGPEMAPYPDAPGQGADDIPF